MADEAWSVRVGGLAPRRGLLITLETTGGGEADILIDAADVAFLASARALQPELEDPDREWWATQERLTSVDPVE